MLKDMIAFLLDSGMTQTQIAEQTLVPQSAISRIIAGDQKEVSYTAGKSVETLHARVGGTKKAAGYAMRKKNKQLMDALKDATCTAPTK